MHSRHLIIKRVTELTFCSIGLLRYLSNGQFIRIESRCLHAAARKKLERIHGKNRDEVIRSQELLKKLRRKNLEGLSQSSTPSAVQLEEKLLEMKYIRRLVSTYKSRKGTQEMTLKNTVTILTKIAELYESQPAQRALLLENEFHLRLLREIVNRVTKSCGECSPAELLNSIISLSKLNEKDSRYWAGFERAVIEHEVHKFTSDQLGIICFSFAKSSAKEALTLFTEVAKEIQNKELVAFSSKSLCHFCWAFSKINLPIEKLLIKIGVEILSRDLGRFESNELSLLAHTYWLKNVPVSNQILTEIEREIFRNPELKKFDSYDLVIITSALLQSGIDKATFRKLETVLVTRRDFLETTPSEDLKKLYQMIKDGPFNLAEIGKILETVLYPNIVNSVFDIFFRPRRSWKEKVLKQSVFKVY